jgi:hypothetical protein
MQRRACFEPVCSAVSGSLLSTPAAASTAGSPRWSPLLGGERGFGGPEQVLGTKCR